MLDHAIRIPRTYDALTPVLASIPLQVLAYPNVVLRGSNGDAVKGLLT